MTPRSRAHTLAFLLCACGSVLPLQGQTAYLPPVGGPQAAGVGQNATPAMVEPPPLVIDGKADTEMTDDERLEFLQSKVKTVNQDDGQVEIVHVAPGYPVSLRFTEPIIDTTVGDKKLVSVQRRGKNLILTALAAAGDTPVQVFFSGDKVRIYHVFASDNFGDGDSSITVRPFSPDAVAVGYTSSASRRDLRDFIRIISNYDVLKQEGALDPRNISRSQIFQENKATGYTILYLYRIHGAAAFTFAFRNLMPYRVRLDESRLRLSIGNSLFLPDYVSLHDFELDPNAVTTGLAILFNPAFDPKQPLEIVWK